MPESTLTIEVVKNMGQKNIELFKTIIKSYYERMDGPGFDSITEYEAVLTSSHTIFEEFRKEVSTLKAWRDDSNRIYNPKNELCVLVFKTIEGLDEVLRKMTTFRGNVLDDQAAAERYTAKLREDPNFKKETTRDIVTKLSRINL